MIPFDLGNVHFHVDSRLAIERQVADTRRDEGREDQSTEGRVDVSVRSVEDRRLEASGWRVVLVSRSQCVNESVTVGTSSVVGDRVQD